MRPHWASSVRQVVAPKCSIQPFSDRSAFQQAWDGRTALNQARVLAVRVMARRAFNMNSHTYYHMNFYIDLAIIYKSKANSFPLPYIIDIHADKVRRGPLSFGATLLPPLPA